MIDPVQLSLGFTNRPHLVAIDDGTLYDIPTSLVELATAIKNGKHGLVLDATVIIHIRNPNGKYDIAGFCYGFSHRCKYVEMCESMKLQLMGVNHGGTTY